MTNKQFQNHLKHLPDTVKIGPFDYKVYAVDELKSIGVKNNHGVTNVDRQVITVWSEVSPVYFVEVLLHEISEAICWQGKVDTGEEDYHDVMSIVITGLTGVLRDNKRLCDWINKALK